MKLCKLYLYNLVGIYSKYGTAATTNTGACLQYVRARLLVLIMRNPLTLVLPRCCTLNNVKVSTAIIEIFHYRTAQL